MVLFHIPASSDRALNVPSPTDGQRCSCYIRLFQSSADAFLSLFGIFEGKGGGKPIRPRTAQTMYLYIQCPRGQALLRLPPMAPDILLLFRLSVCRAPAALSPYANKDVRSGCSSPVRQQGGKGISPTPPSAFLFFAKQAKGSFTFQLLWLFLCASCRNDRYALGNHPI